MTYLIVGNNEENIKEGILNLLKKLWERPIDRDIFANPNPDVHILNGSNINSIGIEDVKNLQKEMVYSPYTELVQIALIFDADTLTPQAQNSFLKTLEESGDNTAYILVTNNEKNILPTMVSRCQKIYTKEVSTRGKEERISGILEMDLVMAFEEIEKISKEKGDTDIFLRDLETHFQKLLEEKIAKGGDIYDIHDSIQKILITKKRIDANGNRRLLLENLFLVLTR